MAEIAGLKLIVPSSVSAGTGTATVSASGKVTFTAADNVSVNDCFNADYDNYLVVMWNVGSATNNSLNFRLRVSATDASGSDYVNQILSASSTTVSGVRGTTNRTNSGTVSTLPSGLHLYWYGPYLVQPTAHRTVDAGATSSAIIRDVAGTHSLSTSYTGFTFFQTATQTLTGALCVYGLSQ